MQSRRHLRANETNHSARMRLHVQLWNEQNSEKNCPSPSVIQTSGGNPNGQQYDQNSTEWNEEQEEFARREAYKLHEKHRKDVHSQHRCLVPYDGSSQTAPTFSLAHSVLCAIHLDLAIFAGRGVGPCDETHRDSETRRNLLKLCHWKCATENVLGCDTKLKQGHKTNT